MVKGQDVFFAIEYKLDNTLC